MKKDDIALISGLHINNTPTH